MYVYLLSFIFKQIQHSLFVSYTQISIGTKFLVAWSITEKRIYKQFRLAIHVSCNPISIRHDIETEPLQSRSRTVVDHTAHGFGKSVTLPSSRERRREKSCSFHGGSLARRTPGFRARVKAVDRRRGKRRHARNIEQRNNRAPADSGPPDFDQRRVVISNLPFRERKERKKESETAVSRGLPARRFAPRNWTESGGRVDVGRLLGVSRCRLNMHEAERWVSDVRNTTSVVIRLRWYARRFSEFLVLVRILFAEFGSIWFLEKKKKKKEEEKIEMNFERVYIYSVLFDIELNIFFIYEIEALWSMKLLWKMITWLV